VVFIHLFRRQIVDGAIGAKAVVIDSPGLDFLTGIIQGKEPLYIQTLITTASIE